MHAPPNGSPPSVSATSSRRCGPPPPRTCRDCRPPTGPRSPASCRDKLLGFLRAVHRGDRTVPVADLDTFAATCADDACRDYLRRTRPGRARLANRLRLLCTRGTGAAMWRSASGQLIAGLPSWTSRDPLDRPFPWKDQPKAWWGNAHAAADGSALVPTVLRIFEKAGAPLPMDALTELVAALTGLQDLDSRLDASPEGDEPELAVLIPGSDGDHLQVARRYLDQAWRECLDMPRYMRTAVLLSLRDQFGAGLLPVFHAAGVTPLRQVGEALGMKPDELAAILGAPAVGRPSHRPAARHHRAAGAQPAHRRALAAAARAWRSRTNGDDHHRTSLARPGTRLRPRRAPSVHAGHDRRPSRGLRRLPRRPGARVRRVVRRRGVRARAGRARRTAREPASHLRTPARGRRRHAGPGRRRVGRGAHRSVHDVRRRAARPRSGSDRSCRSSSTARRRSRWKSPTADFEPAPAPVARRRIEDADAVTEPPAAYGAKPPDRLPRWIPIAAGLSLLLLLQMWAC